MTLPPPVLPGEAKRNEDQLKLLGIFHYLFAGLSVFGLGLLILHRAMLNFFVGNPALWKEASANPAPAILGIFNLFYLVIEIFIAAAGVANFLSGRAIHRRTRRTFSLVVAALNCLQFPFGTALGICTFVVLLRDPVRDVYQQKAEPDPSVFSVD